MKIQTQDLETQLSGLYFVLILDNHHLDTKINYNEKRIQ